MSSDYRPRNNTSGGPRRRRGGRSRSQNSYSNDARPTGNGHTSAPIPQSPLRRLLGWIFGQKKVPAPHAHGVDRPLHRDLKPRPEAAERTERFERPRRSESVVKAEPVLQEITTAKLYVGNLSYDATESDLFDLFSKVGAVKNVEIAIDRRANRSKGFGFVEMDEIASAKLAAEKYNRTEFMGRPLLVSGAKLDRRLNNATEGSPNASASGEDASPAI